MSNWNDYYEQTKNKPPRRSLVKAMLYVIEKDAALDIGSGALNDSMYLLSEGFAHVTALDKEPVAEEIAKTLPQDKFTYVIQSAEDFTFPKDAHNLINAQFSLPFISPIRFDDVWKEITASLKKGGLFVGQLFGDRDEWSTNKNMTFHSKKEAEKLLAYFHVVDFEEDEEDRPTAAGNLKHWHVFHFIARKQ